jgi:hypothetical protein
MKIIIIPIPKSASSSLAHALKKLHSHENVEIIKKHIMPTKDNLDDYKNQKKVVLLRDPQGCRSYSKRGIDNSITQDNPNNKDSFFNYSYEEFYDGWSNNIDNETLLIFYKDLIGNPKKTINKIEKFYGLRKSTEVKLPKLNYSRSKLINFKRNIFIQIRKIKFLKDIRNNYFSDELKRITAT